MGMPLIIQEIITSGPCELNRSHFIMSTDGDNTMSPKAYKKKIRFTLYASRLSFSPNVNPFNVLKK